MATIVGPLRLGAPILGAPVPDGRMPMLARLGQPPKAPIQEARDPAASKNLFDPSTIYHVGMYVSAGNMIVAPYTGAVVQI
jgi:hypothetical protein